MPNQRYECAYGIPRVSVPARCITGQGMAGDRDPALQ